MSAIGTSAAEERGLRMTAAAARRAKVIAAGEPGPAFVRVAVLGGGCSGFQYKFSIDDGAENAGDLRIERDGATILVDDVSANLLQGAEIDFYEGLEGSMFMVSNPNATASCGCGTSFSIG